MIRRFGALAVVLASLFAIAPATQISARDNPAAKTETTEVPKIRVMQLLATPPLNGEAKTLPTELVPRVTELVSFVVDSDVECRVYVSPASLANIVPETGPQTLRGFFSDAPGARAKQRTFKGPFLYHIEPLGTGRGELIVVPKEYRGEIRDYRGFLDFDATEINPNVKPDGKSVTVITPITVKPTTTDPTPAGKMPFTKPGAHVLFRFETSDLSRMPASQVTIINSTVLREFLEANCPVGADGKTKEYRFFDKDTPMAGESAEWRDAMSRKPTKLPSLMICNPAKGWTEIPTPGDVDACIEKIKQYLDY